ncbi:hypothetical protein NQ038_09130 [Brevibacterium sp. 50QC2O2]|jgi:hypothetical protein|uniref:hypothetical protein n=1 Tax=Brevibacterium TaxID=1696 RepID=UPI00211C231F|nr:MULTISPECIES: hypothetical protein [unclassified Brevibacterium]MCQ9385305.1 hypothetical protein [Brevibacterium sp. 68QC2CO]MCQ9388811.1 hypothetical protein [Brevibacterium sp. 50QC2O2]
MPYARDFQIDLRVFEPIEMHPDLADYPVSENRDMILDLVAADADKRLLSLPPDPIADSYRGTPIFMPGSEAGDGLDRVCPVQDDIRSWAALDSLEDDLPRAELDLVVPKSARRRAAAHRVEWLQDDPDQRIFTRTAAWDISPVWWLALDPEEDRVIVSERAGAPWVRIRVPVLTASARVEWAAGVLEEKSRLTTVRESTVAFGEWLDSFDLNAIVELDLGGMTGVLWPDTGAGLVTEWIDSLDMDNPEGARAAFEEYSNHWERLVLYARAN